jgi:hypothetical protein
MYHDPIRRTNIEGDGNPILHLKEKFHQWIIHDNVRIPYLMLGPFTHVEDTRNGMIVPIKNDISGVYVNTDLLVAVQDIILECIGSRGIHHPASIYIEIACFIVVITKIIIVKCLSR